MNNRAGPSGLPHSRAWSLSPPPPRISCVAIGTGGDTHSVVESRSISCLPASMYRMTGTLGPCDRDDIRACTQLPRRGWRSTRSSSGLAGEPRGLVLLDEHSRCRGTTDFPGDAQLRLDITQVPLDGPRAKRQAAGDCLVRQTRRDELEHLELARAEVGNRDRGTRLRVRAQ